MALHHKLTKEDSSNLTVLQYNPLVRSVILHFISIAEPSVHIDIYASRVWIKHNYKFIRLRDYQPLRKTVHRELQLSYNKTEVHVSLVTNKKYGAFH